MPAGTPTGIAIAIVSGRTYTLRLSDGIVPAELMKKLSVDHETCFGHSCRG